MRAKPTDLERINHMIYCINKIFRYTEKIGFKEFSKIELIQDEVQRNFEVIGEAAYHITTEVKKIIVILLGQKFKD